ncbi:MAG TPA: T9SS type A sorting domain-containing protein, partial [Adhaeribacter sp.]|nr:T9SS type A sorting domain-containing protein [Adhaeribacter sp.]
SQTGTAVSSNWTYWAIVLEETTNKVYIVDQRTAGAAVSVTAGIQVNSTTAFMVAGSPNLGSVAANDATPGNNTYYAFTPGTQPTRDMAVTAVTNPTYLVLPNAPFTVTGTIINYGSAPVTSYTLNYAINGGTPVTSPMTVNIPSMGTSSFSHPMTWTPTAAGNYTITAWATDINGGTDENTSNDIGSKQVIVVANTAPRTVLHEVFTSSTCGPCKPGNANLRNITLANPGKSIDIKYQQNFPAPGNDPYQTTESINRRGYYNVNSIPRMEVDGGWDGNANSYTTGLLNTAQAKPSLVAISGTHTIIGNTVNATAVIDPIGNNIPSTDLVIHMVITERYTTGNIRTNGETEFYDVSKKMMPNENGTATAPLVAGSPRTLTQSFTFPANHTVEHFDSLQVVIFLQDRVTKEVFQAAHSVRTNSPTGISDDAAAALVNVFPNPTNGIFNVTYSPKAGEAASVVVYNMLGEKVIAKDLKGNAGQLSLDLSGQAAGFYLMNMQLGDKIVIKKISLVK